jgi:hypothetical protein
MKDFVGKVRDARDIARALVEARRAGDVRRASQLVGSFCQCQEPHVCHEDQIELGTVTMILSGWLANPDEAP